jgi:hypothetical protein
MFSCFALPDSFSTVPRESCLVFMFCARGFIFGGTKGVGSLFHALLSRTHFRRYRERRVPFSIFFTLGLIFCGTEGIGSRFHVFFSRTRFQRCRMRQVPFSCFALPNSFFGDSEGVGSHFHVLCCQTRFRRCRLRQVPFSCFARSDPFSAISRGIGSHFHVLCSQIHFRRCRVRRVPFSCFAHPTPFWRYQGRRVRILMFCAPGLIFEVTEGVGSRFHLLRAESFSTVPRASGPVFMFCPPKRVGVGSCFHVFCARTRFLRYRGHQVLFSCFVLPNSFSAVPNASGPVFISCPPGLIFDGAEDVESRFLVLRAQNNFRRYRGRRVPFSYFGRSDSFSAVPRASRSVFMFCAPGLNFGGNEGVG